MSDDKSRNDPDSDFSFGVRELQLAKVTQGMSLNAAPQKANASKLGCDPYNTSGSFDRKKNWTRVGKR